MFDEHGYWVGSVEGKKVSMKIEGHDGKDYYVEVLSRSEHSIKYQMPDGTVKELVYVPGFGWID